MIKTSYRLSVLSNCLSAHYFSSLFHILGMCLGETDKKQKAEPHYHKNVLMNIQWWVLLFAQQGRMVEQDAWLSISSGVRQESHLFIHTRLNTRNAVVTCRPVVAVWFCTLEVVAPQSRFLEMVQLHHRGLLSCDWLEGETARLFRVDLGWLS